jgi:hypothetical protein
MKTDTDPIAEAFRAAFGTVVEPDIDAPSWETFSERAAAVQPEPVSLRPGFLRRPVVVAAVAAASVVVAIGGALLAVGLGSDPAPPADSIPVMFDIRTDRFCEWFTAKEMNEILAVAQQRAGTDFVFEEFTPGTSTDPNCRERVPGLVSHRWATTGWASSVPGKASVVVAMDSWIDEAEVADEFVGHRLLDDEVSYQIRNYTYGWQDGVGVYLQVDRHEDEIFYFGFGVDNHDSVTSMTRKYEDFGLAIANELLQRMNWVSSGE